MDAGALTTVLSTAAALGETRLLIPPASLRDTITVRVGFSNVELFTRVGSVRNVRGVPLWFFHGLAILATNDPAYSEQAWREATHDGASAPPSSELEVLDGWIKVAARHKGNKQFTYGTVRHEAARWYGIVGRAGLERLIADLARGEGFKVSYEAIEAW